MPEDEPDFDKIRQHIQESLNGDLGDEAQEETIIKIFEGELRHKMATLTIIAAENVGSLGKGKNTLIWS